jgi:hypothetical protein
MQPTLNVSRPLLAQEPRDFQVRLIMSVTRDKTPQDLATASPTVATAAMFGDSFGDIRKSTSPPRDDKLERT